jgi:NADH-quinone oxidoreductase subunit G
MILDSRDGEIVRTRSRENKAVNDIWMCDKGWFGYEFVLHEERLKTPLVRKEGKLQPVEWEEALDLIAAKMKEASLSGKAAGFGGNPLTTEECSLFQQLIRKGAGANHVDHRIGMPLFPMNEEVLSPGMQQPLSDCEELSFAFLFGVDLTEEFPVIWLRLKQAINRGAKVFFFGHYTPEIARHLHQTVLHAPGEELELIGQQGALVEQLMAEGKKGAFFIGRQYLASMQRAPILKALMALSQAKVPLNLLEGRGNSMGARWAGMHPECGDPGLNAMQVMQEAAEKEWDLLYVAGANPAKKFPKKMWAQARKNLKFLVVQDLFLTETALEADVVLPTLSFVEKEGTFINIEGRAERLHPGKAIPKTLYSDGEIFKVVAQKLGASLEEIKEFKTPLQSRASFSNELSVPMGSLRATFAPFLFDNGVRMKHDSHLIQLAKKPKAWLHPSEGEMHGLKAGEKVLLAVGESEIIAEIGFDEGVAKQTIVLPLGFDALSVQELGPNLLNGLSVEIRRGSHVE